MPSSWPSVIDKVSKAALVSLLCLEFVLKLDKSNSSEEETSISGRLGQLIHFLHDLTTTALSIAQKDASEYSRKVIKNKFN